MAAAILTQQHTTHPNKIEKKETSPLRIRPHSDFCSPDRKNKTKQKTKQNKKTETPGSHQL